MPITYTLSYPHLYLSVTTSTVTDDGDDRPDRTDRPDQPEPTTRDDDDLDDDVTVLPINSDIRPPVCSLYHAHAPADQQAT